MAPSLSLRKNNARGAKAVNEAIQLRHHFDAVRHARSPTAVIRTRDPDHATPPPALGECSLRGLARKRLPHLGVIFFYGLGRSLLGVAE